MKGGALVLAAGFSRRFGADKRKHLVDGRPLLQRTVQTVIDAGLACRICLRPGDGDIPLLLGLRGLTYIECPGAARGMGKTLAEGVSACGDWEGLLVVLGDMPWVQAATLQTLFAALTAETIVQPYCDGMPGQPVGFGARFYPALRALDADIGGRDLIRANPDAVTRIEVPDAGIHRDLDSREACGH